MSLKNTNALYGLFPIGKYEPKFISDATTLDEFILDCEHYFDYCPSGYYPYKIEVDSTSRRTKDGLYFIKILVTHTNENKTWTDEYFIFDVIYITHQTGRNLEWNKRKTSRIS